MPNSYENIDIIGLKTLGICQFSLILVLICKTVVTKSSEQLDKPKYAELKSQELPLKSQLCDAELQELSESFLTYKVANVPPPTVISQRV